MYVNLHDIYPLLHFKLTYLKSSDVVELDMLATRLSPLTASLSSDGEVVLIIDSVIGV